MYHEMLSVCIGEWIREKILHEVREAKFFSVIADEAADYSNKEQLPLVLRFIFCNTGTTGSAFSNKNKILEDIALT